MSNPPADLMDLRSRLHAITGVPLADIGIAADSRHLSSGGYHCGALDLRKINAIGRNDYSIRQWRDRAVYNADVAAGRNWASALDLDADWPNGGRPAWLRFNKLLRHQLGINDPALVAIRGINFTPNDVDKRRYDCLTDEEYASTDSVAGPGAHTHIERWRDTIGIDQFRWATLRIVAIAAAAINQTPLDPPAPKPLEAGMLFSITDPGARDQVLFTDALGNPVQHLTRCIATPNGPVAMMYGEIIDAYTAAPAMFLPITWARLQDICRMMRQPASQ